MCTHLDFILSGLSRSLMAAQRRSDSRLLHVASNQPQLMLSKLNGSDMTGTNTMVLPI